LRATVCFNPESSTDQPLFSCPGGEVGLQALYVILENIIRNSARHNGEAPNALGDPRKRYHAAFGENPVSHWSIEQIEAKIAEASKGNQKVKGVETGSGAQKHVIDATDDVVQIDVSAKPIGRNGLIELRIKDKRSGLRRDGARLGSARPTDESSWSYSSGVTLKRKWKSLVEDARRKREFAAVPDQINWIIQHEPILDSDGTPEPNYWGLREMQICAQYLRQFLLSDLEGLPQAHGAAPVGEMLEEFPLIRAEREEYEEDGETKYCLSYVIYVNQATLRSSILAADEGEPTDWSVQPGFAVLKLSGEDLLGLKSASPGSELAKALDAIGNYSFVDYSDDPVIEQWVAKHRERLPVRCLPSNAIAGSSQMDLEDPLAAMEPLHKAYAESISELPEGHQMAGFAIADDGLLEALRVLGPQNENWSMPISCSKDGIDAWANSVGSQNIQAAVWIDHVDTKKIKRIYRKIDSFIANYSKSLELVSWEACFTGIPASSALDGLKRHQGWELIAASLPRVAVLDERVQAQAVSEFRSIRLRKYWRGMCVAVPRKSVCNLDQPTMASCRKWLSRSKKTIHFLIVHLTLLERLRDERGLADATAVILELIAENPHLSETQIAVVTGRGVATFGRSLSRSNKDLSIKKLRYLPISTFLEYLVRRPSKLGLMRALWSASKPEERE
jgi:hypothetical protein